MLSTWNDVIDLAVAKYKREQELENIEYGTDDAMVYALEEFDTGYNLTDFQWDQMKDEIKEKVTE